MATIYDENSLCELMYKMRDAMLSHKLNHALMLSRQIHDRILFIIANEESIGCVLESDVKSVCDKDE